jgi:hypothetical protein
MMSTGSFDNATVAAAVPTQFAEGRGYSAMILTTSMHDLCEDRLWEQMLSALMRHSSIMVM